MHFNVRNFSVLKKLKIWQEGVNMTPLRSNRLDLDVRSIRVNPIRLGGLARPIWLGGAI